MDNTHWYDIFNTDRLIFFLAGMAIAIAWSWNTARRKHFIIDWTPVCIIAGMSVIVFVAVQQLGLSEEVKRCQGEFTSTLQARANISDETDSLAGQLVDANAMWINHILNPPREIADLPANDPIRRAWMSQASKDYSASLMNLKDVRQKAIDERKQLKYPQPQCGNKS